MVDVRRTATACGAVAPAVAFLAILVATTLLPTFTWTGSALSDTGAAGAPTFWVFNGGLILAGVLGLPFGWRLWTAATNGFERLGTVAFLVAVVALGLVGVLHLPRPGHGAVAVTHYVAATFTLWLYGSGAVLAGRVLEGLATIWLGIGHVLFWLVWAATLAPGPVPGLAVPETVGALAFAGWLAWRARALRDAG